MIAWYLFMHFDVSDISSTFTLVFSLLILFTFEEDRVECTKVDSFILLLLSATLNTRDSIMVFL